MKIITTRIVMKIKDWDEDHKDHKDCDEDHYDKDLGHQVIDAVKSNIGPSPEIPWLGLIIGILMFCKICHNEIHTSNFLVG